MTDLTIPADDIGDICECGHESCEQRRAALWLDDGCIEVWDDMTVIRRDRGYPSHAVCECGNVWTQRTDCDECAQERAQERRIDEYMERTR